MLNNIESKSDGDLAFTSFPEHRNDFLDQYGALVHTIPHKEEPGTMQIFAFKENQKIAEKISGLMETVKEVYIWVPAKEEGSVLVFIFRHDWTTLPYFIPTHSCASMNVTTARKGDRSS